MIKAPFVLPEDSANITNVSSIHNIMDESDDATGLVLPGQVVTTLHGYMRGYGTYSPEEAEPTLVAAVSGRVLRVNKLLGVVPFRARYKGDVGDVVIGRVVEVQQKRWKLEMGATQQAVLMLSSINLPGGVLRRRTDLDALQMRRYFVEGDLVSAEVQQFFGDGSMSVHTRSLKYGKLRGGQIVCVDSQLIRRAASSFVQMDVAGNRKISLILAANGWCWVGVPEVDALKEEDLLALPEDRPEQFMDDFDAAQAAHIELHSLDAELRESIACVANLIAICHQHHRPIHAIDTLAPMYAICVANNVRAHMLLDPTVAHLVLRV